MIPVQRVLLAGVSASAVTAGLSTGPGPDPGTWVVADEWIPADLEYGNTGYSFREVIDASVLGSAATNVRIKFTGAPTTISSCYIGFGADGTGGTDIYDFQTAPVQVTFAGSPTVTLADGEEAYSDATGLAYNGVDSIVVSFWIADTVVSPFNRLAKVATRAGWKGHYKFTGAVNDAPTENTSGYPNQAAGFGVTAVEFVLSGVASETFLRFQPWQFPTTLTGFPTCVDLSGMSVEFWEAVTPDGGNIRAYDALGAGLPVDMVYIDPSSETGYIYVRATLDNTVETFIVIQTDPGGSMPANTDPLGRNAVWADFEVVHIFTNYEDRSGTYADLNIVGTISQYDYTATDTSSVSVTGDQGVAFDGAHYYVSGNNVLQKFDLDWELVDENTDPVGDSSIVAPGNIIRDLCVYNGELYLVFDDYPNENSNTQWIGVFSALDLTFARSYDISVAGRNISSICWNSVSLEFMLISYRTVSTTELYRYSLTFSSLGSLTIPATSQASGLTFYGGDYYVSTGTEELFRITADGLTKTLMWAVPTVGLLKGCDADLTTGDILAVFAGTPNLVYTLSPIGGNVRPGWLNADGNGYAQTALLPVLTDWTFGISYVAKSENQAALLSYTGDTTADIQRATLYDRSLASTALYSSDEGFLEPAFTGITPLVPYRVSASYAGITERKIYHNGQWRATEGPVLTRPGSQFSKMIMGSDDNSGDDKVVGALNTAYLHDGVLTDDWLAFEGVNWLHPECTYDVVPALVTGQVGVMPLTNPSADVDNSGWTAQVGSLPGRNTTRARSLPACFDGGSTPKNWFTQELSVPAAQQSMVNNGQAEAYFQWWQQGSEPDEDVIAVVLTFKDGIGVRIGARMFDWEGEPSSANVWALRSVAMPIPIGTEAIEVGFRVLNPTGAFSAAQIFIDDVGPLVVRPLIAQQIVQSFWGDGSSLTPFTIVAGFLGLDNSREWKNPDDWSFYFPSTAVGDMYHAEDVTAHAASIDLGTAVYEASGLISTLSQDDWGAFYTEFRDVGGALIGTRITWFPEYGPPPTGDGWGRTDPIPVGTREIRFGASTTRYFGGDLNFYMQWFMMTVLKAV